MDKFPPMNTVQKPRFISELTSTSRKYQLNDIWQHLHPTTTDFTNITNLETLTFKTRIDYFLISESLIENTVNCHILPSVDDRLSHKTVQLSIRLPINANQPASNYTRPSKNQYDFKAASIDQISGYNQLIAQKISQFLASTRTIVISDNHNNELTKKF